MTSYSFHKINKKFCSATQNGSEERWWLHSTLKLNCIQRECTFMQNMLITLFWRDVSLLFRKEEKKTSFKPQENTVARTCKGVTLLSILRSSLSCLLFVSALCNNLPRLFPNSWFGNEAHRIMQR